MHSLPLRAQSSAFSRPVSMSTPAVDSSCSSRWNFSSASASRISSGFYTFDYGNSHELGLPLVGIGVIDTTVESIKAIASTLWYYDSDNGVLYNWGWKSSMVIPNCTDPAGVAMNGWNGSPITIDAGGTIYSTVCSKFISPTGLTAGSADGLYLLPSPAYTMSAVAQPTPTLPVIGAVQTNTMLKFLLGYTSTLQNQELYLSVDSNHNLIADAGTGTNSIHWTYGGDKSLSLKLQDGTTVYLSDLPGNQGIRSDGIVVSGGLVGTTPAAWSVPKIDYSPTIWPFPDPSVQGPASLNEYWGADSSFLYNDATQQYLTFRWNSTTNTIDSTIALYPSPQSLSDILCSINVSYVNLPPQSIPSGLYYLQTPDGGKCLRADLTMGGCDYSEAAWNYDATAGSLGAVKGGQCLASSLDQSCAGDGHLTTSSCSQPDAFVLGTNGEFFLDRCSTCYAPTNSLSLGPAPCNATWKFSAVSSPSSGGSKWWIYLICILLIVAAVMFFVMRHR